MNEASLDSDRMRTITKKALSNSIDVVTAIKKFDKHLLPYIKIESVFYM
jgi:hypothetical protein